METYAEKQNKAPFDWSAFLNQETHTDEEWEEATDLAKDKLLSVCENPLQDFTMAMLLSNLHGNLYLKNIERAKKAFERIEKRQTYLKTENPLLAQIFNATS